MPINIEFVYLQENINDKSNVAQGDPHYQQVPVSIFNVLFIDISFLCCTQVLSHFKKLICFAERENCNFYFIFENVVSFCYCNLFN